MGIQKDGQSSRIHQMIGKLRPVVEVEDDDDDFDIINAVDQFDDDEAEISYYSYESFNVDYQEVEQPNNLIYIAPTCIIQQGFSTLSETFNRWARLDEIFTPFCTRMPSPMWEQCCFLPLRTWQQCWICSPPTFFGESGIRNETSFMQQVPHQISQEFITYLEKIYDYSKPKHYFSRQELLEKTVNFKIFFVMMESLARFDLNSYFVLCRENIIKKKLKSLRRISRFHKMSKVIFVKQQRQALKTSKQSCCQPNFLITHQIR